MLKSGLSSQSVGGVLVGLGGVLDEVVELLDADEGEEFFEVAESDACSLIDWSCELSGFEASEASRERLDV